MYANVLAVHVLGAVNIFCILLHGVCTLYVVRIPYVLGACTNCEV